MTVYVDAARHKTGPRGRVKYCHLTADSVEELHAFALKIGVKRCWFEVSRRGVPHYDLNEKMRSTALENGARCLTSLSSVREKVQRTLGTNARDYLRRRSESPAGREGEEAGSIPARGQVCPSTPAAGGDSQVNPSCCSGSMPGCVPGDGSSNLSLGTNRRSMQS